MVVTLAGPVRIPARLDSTEYKMLLDAAHFDEPAQGMDGFWDRLDAAAHDSGAEIERCPDEIQKEHNVTFLDTADFALRDRDYILRRRTRTRASGNLTLKFRSADRQSAAQAPVEAAPDQDQKVKFERDAVYRTTASERFSKSSKVKMDKLPKGDVSDFAAVFPVLEDLGIPADTPIETVQGRHICEEKHELGTLTLPDGETAPLELTLWYEEDAKGSEEHPAVAEFSFKLAEDGHSPDGARKFMTALQGTAGDWMGTGGTKTDWIYSPNAHPQSDSFFLADDLPERQFQP